MAKQVFSTTDNMFHQSFPLQIVPIDQLRLLNELSVEEARKNTTNQPSLIRKPNTFVPRLIDRFNRMIFKSYKFILLDQFIVETPETYEKVSGTYQWEIYQDQVARCEEYIRKECADERVFLVTSGGLGAQVVPYIHNLPQLYAVYVHCLNVISHMEWALRYSKVRMVCDNDRKYLVPQLALDVAQSNLEWVVELLKMGDKVNAKKKLDWALMNIRNYVRPEFDSDLPNEIERKLQECK